MGCGNPKEKVEYEMMKMKMARIELQMERQKQLEKLKNIEGKEMKTPEIPDSIDQNFINEHFTNRRNSLSTLNKNTSTKQKGRKRARSLKIKRKTKNYINVGLDIKESEQ